MNKIFSIEVFGIHIFESDAEQWLKLCKDQKREWILKNTKQTDESLITEFINKHKISKECKCLDCGKNKKDVATRVSEEITTATEPVNDGGVGKRDSVKRSKNAKGTKGK